MLKSFSYVFAGEKELDSIAIPVIPILGFLVSVLHENKIITNAVVIILLIMNTS